MLCKENIAFKVQHDIELNFLRASWQAKGRIILLRTALGQLLQLAQQLHVRYVQLELEHLPDLPVYDQLWLSMHWMPKVLALPLERVVVLLQPAQVYNTHAIEMLLAGFRLFIKFDVQFFTQDLPGLQWLTADSARLPAIQAEWQAAGELPAIELAK